MLVAGKLAAGTLLKIKLISMGIRRAEINFLGEIAEE